jgi:hypothetical protein
LLALLEIRLWDCLSFLIAFQTIGNIGKYISPLWGHLGIWYRRWHKVPHEMQGSVHNSYNIKYKPNSSTHRTDKPAAAVKHENHHRGCWLNSNGKNSIPSFIYTQPYNSLMGPWQCLCSIYKTSKEHSNTVNNMYLEAAQQSEQKLNGHNPASQGWGFPGWAPQNACLHASNASSTFQHNDAHMSLLVCQVSCVEKTPHSDRNISQPVSYTSSSCNTIQRTSVNQAMLTKALLSHSAQNQA